jgi:AAA+ superfamily predicted ATPase
MARADLVLELTKHSLSGNKPMVKKIVEAIIAEERSKDHHIYADRLESELNKAQYDYNQPIQNGNTLRRTQLDLRAENLVIEVHPERDLNSLILPDAVSEICNQYVEEQHRTDLLRSYGLEPRNKILLIGAPGNGKTTLAEAIAEALMVPLYIVKYDSIVGSYLGETASRLRKLMDFVSSRKCVLFFDEFETLGKERGETHETGEIKRVVSSLLLQIDDLPSHVTIIGATNHPELLDRAVWRRFQIRVNLPMPTRVNIAKWFNDFQERHKIDFSYSSETLAKRLYGISYSEIEEFGLSVLRRHVLTLPDQNIRDIVSEELKSWKFRTSKVDPEQNQLE